jgi:hypothetical protein
METYKPQLDEIQKRDYAEKVHAALMNGGKLLIQITHTSSSNLSYRYKVNLAAWNGKEIELTNLTYWLGAEYGQRVVQQWAGDELKGRGLGTDRYFLAAYELGHVLKKYGLISDVYEIASRKVYDLI